MRSWLLLSLAVIVLLGGVAVRADEKDEKLEAQKKKAVENWKKVDGGAEAIGHTEHFVIVAPKAMGEKLKEIGELLEKFFDKAREALFTAKDTPIKSRITVYLLEQPEQIDAFMRRIEKKRPRRQESGRFNAEDDVLHVAAVQREKSDPPVEVQAAQEVASLLMQRRAGPKTILPDWLLSGFGRATYYRVEKNSPTVARERQAAVRILQTKKSRNAQDVWNGLLEGDEPAALQPALADFFAYGPARMKLPALLEAFRPGENEDQKSMDQALQAVELKVDSINKTFRTWALRPN